jgi:hypothetical protein
MQPAELAITASSAKLVQFMGSLHARGFHMLQPVINLGTNSGGVHELVSLSGREPGRTGARVTLSGGRGPDL